MICRKTKIAVMYYVTDRGTENLHPLIKKHVQPGTVMFSDEHGSYVNI